MVSLKAKVVGQCFLKAPQNNETHVCCDRKGCNYNKWRFGVNKIFQDSLGKGI